MANFDDLLNNAPTEQQGDAPRLSPEEYAEKMKAAREGLFELSDSTAMEVAADGGRFRQYLDVQGRFDRYSAVNVLLIMAQQESLGSKTATRLGDFDYWKKQNAFVKEKSIISILEPHEYVKDDGTPGVGYNAKKVFDISQTDTRKMRATPPSRLGDRQLLKALVDKAPVTITGVDELPGDLGAMTDPETGAISVRKGMEFPDTFRAVAQELAYAELTAGEAEQTDPRFSAYCASYLLCKKHGVDTQGFSFDGSPGVFEGMDAQEVKGELSQIRNAAENIGARMARQLEAQQKAAKENDAR
jgi:hypothetical protein